MYFITTVLLIVSFVGFFNYTKYSLYCIIAHFAIDILSGIILIMIFANPSSPTIIGTVVGALLVGIPIIIYYYKRKDVFINKCVFRKEMNNAPLNTNYQKSISYCRKCGAELTDDSLFCRKCGTQIIEKEKEV